MAEIAVEAPQTPAQLPQVAWRFWAQQDGRILLQAFLKENLFAAIRFTPLWATPSARLR